MSAEYLYMLLDERQTVLYRAGVSAAQRLGHQAALLLLLLLLLAWTGREGAAHVHVVSQSCFAAYNSEAQQTTVYWLQHHLLSLFALCWTSVAKFW